MAVPTLFRTRLEESPGKVAVRTVAEAMTFAEWGRRSAALSQSLEGFLGPLRGERICLWMTNDEAANFVAGLQSIFDLGAVVVALDDRFAPAEAARVLGQADARGLLIGPQVADRIGSDGIEVVGVEAWDVGDEGWSASIVPIEGGVPSGAVARWRAEDGGDAEFTPRAKPGDMALIAFTSGSTGTPKGAVWKSADVVQYAERVANATYAVPRGGKPLRSEDVLQSPIPLHTAASLIENVYPTVYAGNELIFEGRRFDASASEGRMEVHGTTVYNGVPAMYALMCDLEERHPHAAPELLMTSGSPITAGLYRRMKKRWPAASVANWYGLNESGTGQTVNHGSDMERAPEAIGRPLEPTEVKVVDENLEPVPSGTEGDLLMRAPGQMTAYFRNPEQTEARFRGDWLFTGDRAVEDEDGLIRVVGRNEERINRGGFKFYPAEIESVLEEHEHVREAVVIGVPHPVMGQDPVGFVVPSGADAVDADELRTHLRERLAANKVPAEIVLLEQFPRGAYGKVVRRQVLRDYEAARSERAGSRQPASGRG
ncbi:MAG: acyl--CoA ligase [Actinobacteria bacterium]|nr:acyl--CoA ligase [Actinomycetota bacterium]